MHFIVANVQYYCILISGARMNRLKIKEIVKSRGLKICWLADEINVHPTTLGRFLSGKTNLNAEALLKLLRVLNLDESQKKRAS
jgi:transcriptional regulator with XRE-family HTH domain